MTTLKERLPKPAPKPTSIFSLEGSLSILATPEPVMEPFQNERQTVKNGLPGWQTEDGPVYRDAQPVDSFAIMEPFQDMRPVLNADGSPKIHYGTLSATAVLNSAKGRAGAVAFDSTDVPEALIQEGIAWGNKLLAWANGELGYTV